MDKTLPEDYTFGPERSGVVPIPGHGEHEECWWSAQRNEWNARWRGAKVCKLGNHPWANGSAPNLDPEGEFWDA